MAPEETIESLRAEVKALRKDNAAFIVVNDRVYAECATLRADNARWCKRVKLLEERAARAADFLEGRADNAAVLQVGIDSSSKHCKRCGKIWEEHLLDKTWLERYCPDTHDIEGRLVKFEADSSTTSRWDPRAVNHEDRLCKHCAQALRKHIPWHTGKLFCPNEYGLGDGV